MGKGVVGDPPSVGATRIALWALLVAPLVPAPGCSLQSFDYLQNGPPTSMGGSAGGGNRTDAGDATGGASGGATDAGDSSVGGSSGVGGSTGGAGAGGLGGGAGGLDGGAGGSAESGGRSEPGGGGAGGLDGGAGGGTTEDAGSGGGAGRDADIVPDGGGGIDSSALVAPVHRYRFEGPATSTVAADSVGQADGTVINAKLSGAGTLVLSGSNQYLELPKGILSSLTDATLEIWASWNGGSEYQRLLDFGDSTSTDAGQTGKTFVLLSPSANSQLRGAYNNGQGSSVEANASSAMPTGTLCQVALVLRQSDHALLVYLNGALAAQATSIGPLSNINDAHNWLGHSQYSSDPGFAGTYYDFRIYNAALTADEVSASYAAGAERP